MRMQMSAKKVVFLFFIFALSIIHFPVLAGENKPDKKYSKEFEKLKTLEGSWEAADPENSNEKIRVKFHATSGGSALVERIFPGTPKEMISVYYDRNGKPAMTHYCILANQPELDLVKAKGKNFEFAFASRSNIDVEKETHMHAMTITLKDSDHMIQSWIGYENGKEKEAHTVYYTRVKP